MSMIMLQGVDLNYPIREHQGISLKEFLLHRLYRQTKKLAKFIPALHDVSFTIRDGERVGIIGYNGSGKSTLLRTVGGIYPIAAGTRRIDGSICSLFDISVGFEMDATGWDNIYFRSYLQGETPASIKAKLDDISSFCELGEFLDLPIRCYSTGMLMRLAFSIATSSHPEILLVDEVFAAGDVSFQKKAEARMRGLLDRAKIVVMVGHNLGFLKEFCTRVLWLHQSRIRADGAPAAVIEQYLHDAQEGRAAA